MSRLRCPFFKIFRHGSTHIPGTVTLYSSTLGIDFWAWGGGFSRACVCLFDRLVSWLWRLVGWLIRWVRSERKKDETEPHLPPCRNLKHILIFTFCFIDFSVLPPCLGLEKRYITGLGDSRTYIFEDPFLIGGVAIVLCPRARNGTL